jgi:hypothetical protein
MAEQISSTASSVGKTRNQTPLAMRSKSLGRRSSGGSSFLGLFVFRLDSLLMGGSSAFSLIETQYDGVLDRNDRAIVERVHRGKNAVYIKRRF